MENFTPVASLVGGMLIGAASLVLLLFNGRIAGVSGILGGVLDPRPGAFGWQAAFLVGLVGGGAALGALRPELFASPWVAGPVVTVVAGLLVGFGTRLGSGCTSGHGVCGVSRLSPRSLAATVTFMAFGMGSVAVARHVLGV